ncbi:MAG: hypothetical protein JRF33_08115 [Deltaproteobacteria bacterium]|nr:hypothetical protein [Deltaproteobacteria bacterium]
MRSVEIFAALIVSLLLGLLSACGPVNKNLTVDQIQGVVNSVERNLRHMRKALKEKESEKAAEHYDKAKNLMVEFKDALAGYPERGELEQQVEEGVGDLCYGQVSLVLRAYFVAIRAKARDEAKEQLDLSRAEFERCQPVIRERDDFMALKMNMDSAPESLVDLDKDLFRPKRLGQIKQVIAGLKGDLAKLRVTMKTLEASPDQPTVAAQIDADIGHLGESIKLKKAYEDEELWTGFAAATQGELTEMGSRRKQLVRRGQLLVTLRDVQMADVVLKAAPMEMDRSKAASNVSKARKTYAACATLVGELLGQEKALGKYVIKVKASKRKPAWLKKHCKRSVRLAEKLHAKLLGKKVPPLKVEKKVRKVEKKSVDKATEKKKKKKKKKKKRRRRDVQRW